MKRDDIKLWADNLIENDGRVSWQRVEPVTGQDIARIVRAEEAATDADLRAIAAIINIGRYKG